MASFEDLDSPELATVELAVEDVPGPVVTGQEGVVSDEAGGQAVPLGRLLRTGPTGAPRLVLYRRPLLARAMDDDDLADLVREVLRELVAELLGVDPDALGP